MATKKSSRKVAKGKVLGQDLGFKRLLERRKVQNGDPEVSEGIRMVWEKDHKLESTFPGTFSNVRHVEGSVKGSDGSVTEMQATITGPLQVKIANVLLDAISEKICGVHDPVYGSCDDYTESLPENLRVDGTAGERIEAGQEVEMDAKGRVTVRNKGGLAGAFERLGEAMGGERPSLDRISWEVDTPNRLIFDHGVRAACEILAADRSEIEAAILAEIVRTLSADRIIGIVSAFRERKGYPKGIDYNGPLKG